SASTSSRESLDSRSRSCTRALRRSGHRLESLAAFLTLGYRVWPAVFAGAFVVNIGTAGAVATSLAIALGNTLEGLLGAYLVIHYANGARAFDHAQDVFKFAALAGLLSSLVSP